MFKAALNLSIAALLLNVAANGVARAGPLDTIVYIECSKDGGEPARSTGVLVSSEGHVLTAAHAVPDGSDCVGSIGLADPNNAEPMEQQATVSIQADVALLQFERQRVYPFVGYCEVEDWMIGREVIVAGFPGRANTSAASFRKGVLSTVRTSKKSILETDAETVKGMSGGPVFSPGFGGIIGIVAGAEIGSTGQPVYFGIVAIEKFANVLGLTPAARPCYHQTKEVKFADGSDEWHGGEPSTILDVTEDEGFCFLSEVFGQFNAPADSVFVRPAAGKFELSGNNDGGASHGGRARCFYFD